MQGQTAEQICGQNKNARDAFRKMWKRKVGTPFSISHVITPDEEAKMVGQASGQPTSTPEPKPDKQPVKERTPKPADKPSIFSRFANLSLVEWILVAVVFGHALLIWYDCVSQWGMPGAIGGGLGTLIITAALLLASDPSKNRTSGYALWFALCVDAAAFWVHHPTFKAWSKPGMEVVTICFCIFLCVCSWVSLALFRDYKLG